MADATAADTDTLHVIDPEPARPDLLVFECTGDVMPDGALLPPAAVVVETLAPGTDLRDVLDRGLPGTNGRRPDVVVTRDPDVLAYAARLDYYFSRTLPWNRTYLLFAPDADSTTAMPTIDDRDALAHDAVQADARGAVPPFPWLSDSSCITPANGARLQFPPVLGYDAGDPTARQLAERVVALTASGMRPAWMSVDLARGSWSIRPVPHDSIADALAAGRIGGGVTAKHEALPANTPLRETPMVCGAPGPVPPGYSAIPLIDSRAHVLVRRGSGAAFYIARNGQLWFTRRHAP